MRGRFPPTALDAQAFVLTAGGAYGPAFLALENFMVIKRYNMSDLYAMFVGNLADRIAGGGGFDTPWGEVSQLSARGIEEIQQRLQARGYDIAKIDGKAGMNTRALIGAYQQASRLKVDCWPSEAVLTHLRGSAATEKTETDPQQELAGRALDPSAACRDQAKWRILPANECADRHALRSAAPQSDHEDACIVSPCLSCWPRLVALPAATASAQEDFSGTTYITPYPEGDLYRLQVYGDAFAAGCSMDSWMPFPATPDCRFRRSTARSPASSARISRTS